MNLFLSTTNFVSFSLLCSHWTGERKAQLHQWYREFRCQEIEADRNVREESPSNQRGYRRREKSLSVVHRATINRIHLNIIIIMWTDEIIWATVFTCQILASNHTYCWHVDHSHLNITHTHKLEEYSSLLPSF